MADGFVAKAKLTQAPSEVWSYLVDFRNAGEWMTGIENMTPTSDGPLTTGTCFTFTSRGKERETQVTALEPGTRIALTSTQGGVTATYTYTLVPSGEGAELTLDARCRATGLWKLLHPLIVFAMRKCDASQVTNLKAALNRRG